MRREGRRGVATRVTWRQPWVALTLFVFGLHFAWEILHLPLNAGLAAGTHWEGIKCCFLAAAGDVLLTLAAYGTVAATARDRLWLAEPRAVLVAWFVAIGLVTTILIERFSAHVWGRWAYGPAMPVVLGVGLPPILQWLALPPLTLWLARRHLGWSPGMAPLHPSRSTEATP